MCDYVFFSFSAMMKYQMRRVGIDFTLLNYLRLVDSQLMFYKCLL
jgi:hypothetical protein